ncbi:MAG: hypothetical protein Q8Q32_00115 [bacterium]|nr:hypothetical protein [bacterium]
MAIKSKNKKLQHRPKNHQGHCWKSDFQQWLIVLSIALLVLPTIANAQFSSSTNYQIQAGTVDSLGAYSSSSNFQLFGNIPYIESENTNSSNFQLISGFPFASSVSAIVVVSTPAGSDASSDGGGSSGSIVDTPTSTTPYDLINIIRQISDSLASLLIIQRESPPSLIFEPDETGKKIEDLPDFIGDIFDEPGQRQRPKLDWRNPEVTEIYQQLIKTRFIPILIIAIIVILILLIRRRKYEL